MGSTIRQNVRAARLVRSETMLRIAVVAVLGAGMLLAITAIGRSAAQTNATVSLHKTKLGMVLANAKGHTIYLFIKDKNGKSACNGGCAQFWPPVIAAGKPTAGAGVKSSMLGTTKRSDGRMQVTYNKHPLYTYTLDKQAGQTTGEGSSAFGAKWYVVSARGTAVTKAPSGGGSSWG